MNPPDNNPQTESPNLQKLENDLKTLEQETQNSPSVIIEQSTVKTTTTPTVSVVNENPSVAPTAPAIETIDQSVSTNSSVPPKKNSPLILISIVLVVIALLAAVAYAIGMQFFSPNTATTPVYKACTMEAKICSDGSSVGRVGPNCEFAQCPVSTETPTAIPTMTATPSATPSMSPTGSPASTPTSSPSASAASI